MMPYSVHIVVVNDLDGLDMPYLDLILDNYENVEAAIEHAIVVCEYEKERTGIEPMTVKDDD